MATVVLTGFMATGKTSVGRNLAKRLSRPFVDTDALVEQAEGRSIETIFATDGETYFRRAERRAIDEAVSMAAGAIIATGGGAVVDPENFAKLRSAAPIVCLTARPEVLEARARAMANRPLLQGEDPRRRIERLLLERMPAYAKADLTVDTSDRPIDEVVELIADYLDRQTGSPAGRAG